MLTFFFFFFVFLGPHLQNVKVPTIGVKSELQLPAYTTATATPDLRLVCDLLHRSRRCQILNPLSEVRDRTCNLMVPSRICFLCATTGTPILQLLKLGWKTRGSFCKRETRVGGGVEIGKPLFFLF